jgi:hypothetical protein
MSTQDESLLWAVRAFVYQHFAATARPPDTAATASKFGLDEAQAAAIYAELHQRHALFLEPGSSAIRMAFPFSGVPTSSRVHARGRTYFANCAWDALGIPAVLSYGRLSADCAGRRMGIDAPRFGRRGPTAATLTPLKKPYTILE